MQLTELQEQLESVPNHHIEFSGVCHDCCVPVKVVCYINKEGSETIEGGAVYNPRFGTPPAEHIILKCNKCFKKKRTLTDFVPCGVYSRVVGYLRPVSGWNKGKQEEWKMRKEFVVEGKRR